jgi:hypothetical protein
MQHTPPRVENRGNDPPTVSQREQLAEGRPTDCEESSVGSSLSPGIILLNYTLAFTENITTVNIQDDSDNESFYLAMEEHTSNDCHNNNLASL